MAMVDIDTESMTFNVLNNFATKNRHKIANQTSKNQNVTITKNLKCHKGETIIFIWYKRYNG